MASVNLDPGNAVTFSDTDEPGVYAKAFPFIYSFGGRQSNWVPGSTNPVLNMADLGITVPAMGTTQFWLPLDNDYNFKLLRLVFMTLQLEYTLAGVGYWEAYENIGANNIDFYQFENSMAGDLRQYLFATVTFPDGNHLYGRPPKDFELLGLTIPGGLFPLNIKCIEGWEYSPRSVRTEYLLSRGGGILFEFLNVHPTINLGVSGAAFGMKVRD
jgi:hypothetical protein